MDLFMAMRAFTKVVEIGSFSKAAERLALSTSATSRHVAELEAHLDARLLHRSTRRLSLTDSGRAYYERCVQILDDVEEAEAVAGLATRKPTGVLKLNIPVSFGIAHLAPLFPDYAQHYPEVSLDVTLSDRVVDLVEEGYDLAIRITSELPPTLIARRIASAKMVVCASPAYLERRGTPASPADLSEHNCLSYSYWSSRDEWRFEREGARYTTPIQGTLHANNGDTLRLAALAGLGIILQPTFIVGPDIRRGALRQLLQDFALPELGIYAVYSSRRHLSAKIRSFIDFLVERFGDRPYWDL